MLFINKKNNLPYAIPAGEYKVEVTDSERFGRPMPLIKNVPDRDGIRFHQGSKPKHSTGCVLVPDRRDEDAIAKLILDDKAKKIESSITIRNHRSPSPAPNDSDDDDSDDEGLDSPVGSGSPRGSSESEQKSGSGGGAQFNK
ncbi:hypothetical protein AGMMS49990_05200 [Endomicrobiia bacterium]|nr:hypothetical protein AGMMS49990_05200 [Endomicrobiia bacterium]